MGDGDEMTSARAEELLLDQVEGMSGREVGLLVHALLERTPLHEPAPPREHLRNLAEEWLGAAAGATSVNVGPEEIARGVSLAAAFWSSPVVRYRGLPGP